MLKKKDKEKRTAGPIFQKDDLSHIDLVTRLQELDKREVRIKHTLIKYVQTNIGRIKTPESFFFCFFVENVAIYFLNVFDGMR